VSGHGDEGLQPERTTLAWVRTAALLAAVTVVFLRTAPGSPHAVAVVGIACLTGPLSLLVSADRFHRRRVRDFGEDHASLPLSRIMILILTTIVLATATGLFVAC
jgi:hypothetical protein